MRTYNFKRIGDLQTFGVAFISLYLDEMEQGLYVSVRTTRETNAHPVFILSPISPSALSDYMEKRVSLKKTMRASDSLFIRFFDEKSQWTTEPVEVEDLNKWIPRDKKFLKSYCHDKSTIAYYIQNHFTKEIV